MTNCQYDTEGRCRWCRREINPEKHLRRCSAAPGAHSKWPRHQSKQGLGDRTEAALKQIGITQDRYKAAKELFGLEPCCSCSARKEWLNQVSAWWREES